MIVIAIDPGDKHVGLATWSEKQGAAACEVDAEKFLLRFERLAKNADVVVVEAFRLYPDKAQSLSRSRMKTSEMIGAIKWIAHKAKCEVVEQGAAIKIPTEKQCKARGIDVTHRSTHAGDALVHLHHFLLRNDLEVK